MSLSFDDIVRRLVDAGISSPRMEARMLMDAVTADDMEKIVGLRCNHYPLDKLLGYRDFYKNTFYVDENVLSPRPDTEILVEAAVRIINENNFKNVLDLGTGSGCILLSILDDCKNINGIGLDQSPKALDVAHKNAQKLNLSERVNFVEGSWFDENLIKILNQKFDVIVSNPPYIPKEDIKGLDKEVKEHDPLSALDGGIDGYDHYKQIAGIVPYLLSDEGYILLEAGIGQAQKIMRIFEQAGLQAVNVIKDLSAIERCVILKK